MSTVDILYILCTYYRYTHHAIVTGSHTDIDTRGVNINTPVTEESSEIKLHILNLIYDCIKP